jgi:hypothetical protein
MSTAVLEIAEKAKKLTPEEWDELLDLLEDIEDHSAAGAAGAKDGKNVRLADLKRDFSDMEMQEINRACDEGLQQCLHGDFLTAEQMKERLGL